MRQMRRFKKRERHHRRMEKLGRLRGHGRHGGFQDFNHRGFGNDNENYQNKLHMMKKIYNRGDHFGMHKKDFTVQRAKLQNRKVR